MTKTNSRTRNNPSEAVDQASTTSGVSTEPSTDELTAMHQTKTLNNISVGLERVWLSLTSNALLYQQEALHLEKVSKELRESLARISDYQSGLARSIFNAAVTATDSGDENQHAS